MFKTKVDNFKETGLSLMGVYHYISPIGSKLFYELYI
ncbi:hypothetical protein J2T04_003392 [Chryseobacterium lathyri]|uniref:Uncharacterized protein n=1 Tax=Chryseobacterium lathyri TaxID=395933 RepID=A0ABT9SRR9_9FLAO|nr:hypothetical protein [Chryseobacterium lathyri]